MVGVTKLVFTLDEEEKRLVPSAASTVYDLFDGENNTLVLEVTLTGGWVGLGCQFEVENINTGAQLIGGTRTDDVLTYTVGATVLEVGTLAIHLRGTDGSLVIKTEDYRVQVYNSADLLGRAEPLTTTQYDLLTGQIGAMQGDWASLRDELDNGDYDGYTAIWDGLTFIIPVDETGKTTEAQTFDVIFTAWKKAQLQTLNYAIVTVNSGSGDILSYTEIEPLTNETYHVRLSCPAGFTPAPSSSVDVEVVVDGYAVGFKQTIAVAAVRKGDTGDPAEYADWTRDNYVIQTDADGLTTEAVDFTVGVKVYKGDTMVPRADVLPSEGTATHTGYNTPVITEEVSAAYTMLWNVHYSAGDRPYPQDAVLFSVVDLNTGWKADCNFSIALAMKGQDADIAAAEAATQAANDAAAAATAAITDAVKRDAVNSVIVNDTVGATVNTVEGYATAEGYQTAATGPASHAEGKGTQASGNRSHAEGNRTQASGNMSHAEGDQTVAQGSTSHAEGHKTQATGDYAHSEGFQTVASANYAHAEGAYETGSDTPLSAGGMASHAEGLGTNASGRDAHAEGCLTVASADDSHAEGYKTTASGQASHAEGNNSTASGSWAHAEGESSQAIQPFSHAEGYQTTADGPAAHAEGGDTTARGNSAHAEGNSTSAGASFSHAEGYGTTASGIASHAEGGESVASGRVSHAEGQSTKATQPYSHAEGFSTESSGQSSHAEGEGCIAGGYASHAEGYYTRATADQSHAGGSNSSAGAFCSFAHGDHVNAGNPYQVVFGKYSMSDSNALFVVGNGDSSNRKNVFTIGPDGSLTIGSTTLTEAKLSQLISLTSAAGVSF